MCLGSVPASRAVCHFPAPEYPVNEVLKAVKTLAVAVRRRFYFPRRGARYGHGYLVNDRVLRGLGAVPEAEVKIVVLPIPAPDPLETCCTAPQSWWSHVYHCPVDDLFAGKRSVTFC